MRAIAAAGLLAALAARAGATELTKETWDEATAGKSVFVKFLAPWCGHCKSMKPDYDKLIAEYEGHASILIADVDCTTPGGKDLCEEVGVQGFPTIKYGDPNNLEDYEGGRDLKALSAFAKENLGPRCGPANIDLCDAESKATLDGFLKLDAEAIAEKITAAEAELKTADTELEELLKSLQDQYEKGQKANKEKKEAIKAAGLGLMKSVQAHQKATGKAEL